MTPPIQQSKSVEKIPKKEQAETTFANNDAPSTDVASTEPTSEWSRKSLTSKSILLPVDASFFEMVTGSGMDNELSLEDDLMERKSHVCCFCCCDLPKACIVVDSVEFLLAIAVLVVSLLGYEQSFIDTIDLDIFENIESYDDDEVIAEVYEERRTFVAVTIMTGIGILFSIIGIIGAIKLNKYLVLANAVWTIADLIRSLVAKQWFFPIVFFAFLYPRIALAYELFMGNITKENYKVTEEHCCCKGEESGMSGNEETNAA